MIYEFVTRYTAKPFTGEVNNGEYLVDPTGYIPTKRQVENMLYAGAALDQSRLEDYDFRPGDELDYKEEFDLRKPDADFTDADRIMQHIQQRAGQSEAESGSADASGDGVSYSGSADGSDGKSVE